MAIKTIDETKLSAIGDAIRAKTGDTALLTLDDMPNEIANIETGGGSAGGDNFLTWYNEFMEHVDTNNLYYYEIDFPDAYFVPSIGNFCQSWNNIPPSYLDDDRAIYTSEFQYYGSQESRRITKINLPNLRVIIPFLLKNLVLDTNVVVNEFTNVRIIDNQGLAYFNRYHTVSGIKLLFPELKKLCDSSFDTCYADCVYLPKLKLSTAANNVYIFSSAKIPNIYIGDAATFIGHTLPDFAPFWGNTAIEKLILNNSTPPTLSTYLTQYAHDNASNRFYNGSAKIYVPKSALADYESATNWSIYYAAGNILAIEDSEADLKGIWPELDEKYGWTD